MSILEKIKTVPFSSTQYIDESVPKNQIYIHHTASSPDPYGVIKWWESTPETVATAFIVGGREDKSGRWKDGDLIQVFGSGKWAWHLGLKASHLKAGGPKAKTNKELNRQSIGVEVCAWGGLTKTNNGFKTYAGNIITDSEVIEYPNVFRGYKYYQKYTTAQIDILGELLLFLCNKWSINKTYIGDRMFDICPDALQGNNAIYSHVSVRPDKSDMHPQPELISMLKSL